MRRGTIYSEEMTFSPLIPEGCSSENIFLQIPQQEQLQQRETIPATASVTFRNADGEIWPWPLAEVPVTLELIELPKVSSKPQEQQVMAPVTQEKEDFPLIPLLLMCAALMAGMFVLYRSFHRK